MVIGIGVDVTDLERFAAALARSPRLRRRLFTDAESHRDDGTPLPAASLAARFAAKEAVVKALGGPAGLEWHDCEIDSEASGRPVLRMSGTVLAAAAARGIERWHLTLSHDGGVAIAFVVAEGGR